LGTAGTEQTFEKAVRNWHEITLLYFTAARRSGSIRPKAYEFLSFFYSV